MLGPAFVVSIGYIDPGNWATDLAAGAYGYRLLWVVGLANAIAIVLQMAVAHVTISTGKSLAILMADRWPAAKTTFWVVFQATAIATDLAEFTGIVLGIELVFRLSIYASIGIGLLLVAALLTVTSRAAKIFEYALMAIVAVIAAVFLCQIPALHPQLSELFQGAAQPVIPNAAAVVVIVGIIGATVMPHNLFLHSSLILENCKGCTPQERRRRGAFFAKETFVALNIATFINAGILIFGAQLHGAVGSIEQSFHSLGPAIGDTAAFLFGGALLLSGLAASATATVSGDYIFSAFSPIRCNATVRRAVTLLPAAIALAIGASATNLLIWSQVALALALPAVLIPLVVIMLRERVGRSNSAAQALVAASIAMTVLCILFDGAMIAEMW
jgi:manganese transport protein